MLVLAIAAPYLLELLLGSEWRQSGIFLRWLTVWLFFSATVSPLTRLFAVVERQHELTILNTAYFAGSAVSLTVGGLTGDATFTVALFSSSCAAVWIIQAFRLLHVAGVTLREHLTIVAREALKAIPFAAIMWGTITLTDNVYFVTLMFALILGVFGIARAKHVIYGNTAESEQLE